MEDALATQDDELDCHMAMLPLVRFIEKAATLAGDAPWRQAVCAAPCRWIAEACMLPWDAVTAHMSVLHALMSRPGLGEQLGDRSASLCRCTSRGHAGVDGAAAQGRRVARGARLCAPSS